MSTPDTSKTIMKFNPEKTQLSLRLGVAVSGAGFIIWCTLAVSGFMRDTREYQKATTATLGTNQTELSTLAEGMRVLAQRQGSIISDRWKYSDQLPWAYQLERANRDVLREGGAKGLVVPDPSDVIKGRTPFDPNNP